MKKFLLITVVIAILLTLVACADNGDKENNNSDSFEGGLERIYASRYYEGDYYRDIVTDVMYLCVGGPNGRGLTEMTDPETGLPLTYTRYLELQNNNGGSNK